MLERLRLFLIIALGEVVLTSGRAFAEAEIDWMVFLSGAFAVAILVSLWALYFSGSDNFVTEHFDRTNDPILAARLAINGMVVIVAGLVTLAVANTASRPVARRSPTGWRRATPRRVAPGIAKGERVKPASSLDRRAI